MVATKEVGCWADCTAANKMLCCKKKTEKVEIVPHPDGGWGWFVCLATFTTQFIVLGTMNNFGLIYVELLKEFPGASISSAGEPTSNLISSANGFL